MQSRIRRLTSDYERVASQFGQQNQYIRLAVVEGSPPDRYSIKFNLRGLVEDDDGRVASRMIHQAEVFLPLDYPRRPPFCWMVTPVFHPNIDPQKICIGDHWSAGQSLATVVAQIAEMICFQSYNVKSPLNAKAAAWAEQNVARLPLQRGDVTGGL